MNANTHSQGRTRWRDTGISWTANQKVEVSLTLPSSSPTRLRADPGDGQVTLRWEPVAGARGYQYRVLEGNRIVKNDWFSASYGTTSSGVVTGLTNGTTYQFQVRAMERGPATRYIEWVGGPWSNGISATPVGPPPAACSGRGLAPHHFLQTQRHPPARAVAA